MVTEPVRVVTVSAGEVVVTVTELIKELVCDAIKLVDTAVMELVTVMTIGVLDKAVKLAAVALVVTGSEVVVVAADSAFSLLPSPFFSLSVLSSLPPS